MADTTIESSRNVTLIDGEQQFRIVTVCTAKGDLPDTGIFVHQIMDSDDPAEDEFIRVAEIVDFDEYLDDRVAAVAAGNEYWRSYTLTKFYTDIEVANAAKTAIQDRVDELVSGYQTYVNSFLTSSEVVDLPTGQATLLDSLNTAYNTAYDNYETAVADEATAQTSKDDADSEFTSAQTALQSAQTVYDSAVARRAEMAAAQVAMNGFGNTGAPNVIAAIDAFKDDYDTAYPSGDPNIDAAVNTLVAGRGFFQSDRNDFLIEENAAQAGVENHDGYVTTVNSLILIPAQADYMTAEEDVRTTTQALAEAEAATATAYASLEAAYNAAKSACNTWTPDAGKSFPPIS